jgi:hypothetical protein
MLASEANKTGIATRARERLTWNEICRRYPDEWVVLVETEWVNDTDFEFRSAVVVAHHNSRKAVSPEIKAAFGRARSRSRHVVSSSHEGHPLSAGRRALRRRPSCLSYSTSSDTIHAMVRRSR